MWKYLWIYPIHCNKFSTLYSSNSTSIHGLLINFSSFFVRFELCRSRICPRKRFQVQLQLRSWAIQDLCVSGIRGRRLSNLILQHFAVSFGLFGCLSVVYDLRLGVASYFKKLPPTSAFVVCSFSVFRVFFLFYFIFFFYLCLLFPFSLNVDSLLVIQ